MQGLLKILQISFRINNVMKGGFVFNHTARSFFVDFEGDIFGRRK